MLFNKGDKIVCIKDGEFFTRNKYIKPSLYLKEGRIYTVDNSDCVSYDLSLVGNPSYYCYERFISLIEYRKRKILKIINNAKKR